MIDTPSISDSQTPSASGHREKICGHWSRSDGLRAAYEPTKLNLRPILLESCDKVGGLARTENYKRLAC